MAQPPHLSGRTFKISAVSKKKSATGSCCPAPSGSAADKPPCCGPATVISGGLISERVPGFLGWLETPSGKVPRISSQLRVADHGGAWLARWGIGRMTYIVPPGLYALGTPTESAPVLVTANYKMTYDLLRRVLSGRDCWLLVLETHGVNVWCAAGKTTFGTGELVKRVITSGLAKIVSHRRLILPILGGPGVAAHKVTQRCGFAISYVTVRSADLPEYLDNGMVTTPAMRQVTFTLYERAVLIPVEIILSLKTTAVIGSVLLAVATLLGGWPVAVTVLSAYLVAVLCGLVLGPLLLPWLPSPSFAVKGALLGAVAGALYCAQHSFQWGAAISVALTAAMAAVSAFHTLNFTGCTPYASRSGVKLEMRRALPAMAGALLCSLLLALLVKFHVGGL